MISNTPKFCDTRIFKLTGANGHYGIFVFVGDVIWDFIAITIMQHRNRAEACVFEVQLISQIPVESTFRVILIEIEIEIKA